MLNEIFKGMDNAAEQINENFNNLEIEIVKANGGICEKYSDGRMVCYPEEPYDLVGHNLDNPLRITFAEPFERLHALQHNIFRDAFDFTGRMISRAGYPSKEAFRHAHEGTASTATKGSYIAFGTWK